MALAAGTRLGPYEIVAPLGAGGMGEVYQAHDSKLGRDVALKILPKAFAFDPERLARFRREARTLASLNHPNIAAIYGLEESGDAMCLVLELVEGETLRGPLPVDRALEYARQVAEALEAAHEKRIIHRDLKPANVKVTPRGRVKVLDFGLAKAVWGADPDQNLSQAKTVTMLETLAGHIVGTPPYMSPEQARGNVVDRRTDIWAFGCLLYELLSGRRAFQGETRQDTFTSVLVREPDWSALPAKTPTKIRELLQQCLQKDVGRRLPDIRDGRQVIQDLTAPRGKRLSRPQAVGIGIATLVLLLMAAGGGIWWETRISQKISVPALVRLTSDAGLTTDPALSSDGKFLAYASDRSGEGNLDIYVKQVGGGEPLRLTRGPGDKRTPAFSPDGTTIAFRSESDDGVCLVSTLGGPGRCVAPGGLGPQFSPDGKWIAYWAGGVYESSLTIRDSARIYIVSSAGGAPRQLHPEFVAAAYPIWSPDGKHLLFLGNPGNTVDPGKDLDWWVTSSDGGPAIKTGVLEATRRAKLSGNSDEVYPWLVIPSAWEHGSDRLVFSAQAGDSTNLWRIGISPKTWKATGRPERLTSGATHEESPSAAPGLGGSIRIAFASLSQNLDIWSVPVEPNQGKVTGEPQRLTRDVGADFHPALSPDGKKMAWVAERSGSEEVWVKDLQTGEEAAITFSRTKKWLPRFSPDGSKISFGEDNKIHVVPSVGGVPEVVCQACGEAMDWSSDGKSIIGETEDGRPWVVDLASQRRTDLFASRHQIVGVTFSPDNRWLTFGVAPSWLTYIAPFRTLPIAENAWIEVVNGWGLWGWSPKGDLIYVVSRRDGHSCIWAQRVDTETKRPIGAPFAVFHAHKASWLLSMNDAMALSRDQMLFTMAEQTGNIWIAEWEQR